MKIIYQFKILSLLIIIYSGINAQNSGWNWAKSSGGDNTDCSNAIATDLNGNTYITGHFYSKTIHFGTTTLQNSNLNSPTCDLFVAKYTSAGLLAWVKKAGGSGYDLGTSIVTDAYGNVLITGVFMGSIGFGTITLNSIGFINFYIAKYDPMGNVLWAKSAGGTADDYVSSLSIDQQGNSYLTGFFKSDSLRFGNLVLNKPDTNTSYDLFVAKYNSSGNIIWVTCAGGSGEDESYSITCDNNGNPMITGYFVSDTIRFGNYTLTKPGSSDKEIFIAKYDSSGNLKWVNAAGGTGEDVGNSVSCNNSGDVFLTGYFTSDTVCFDNYLLTKPDTSISKDIFISKYDSLGNFKWAKAIGGLGDEVGTSIICSHNVDVLLTGYFYSDSINFGSNILVNNGESDFFIVKYDSAGACLWSVSNGEYAFDQSLGITVDQSDNILITGSFYGNTIHFGSNILYGEGATDAFVAKFDITTGEQILTQDIPNIRIYPNPVSDYSTLQTNFLLNNASLILYNIDGKIVRQIKEITGEEVIIKATNMVNGLYYYRLIENNKTVSKGKIVVTH